MVGDNATGATLSCHNTTIQEGPEVQIEQK